MEDRITVDAAGERYRSNPRYPGVRGRTGKSGVERFQISLMNERHKRQWLLVPEATSLREAHERRTVLQGRKLEGGKITKSRYTFGQVAEKRLAEEKLHATAATVRQAQWAERDHLVPLMRYRLQEIDYEMATRIAAGWTEAGLSKNSQAAIKSVISRTYAYARTKLEIPCQNPFTHVRSVVREDRLPSDDDDANPVRIVTAEEIERILAAAPDEDYAAIWRVALATGLRRGEILNLRWRDVVRAKLEIYVREYRRPDGTRHKLKTKNSKRTIPISRETANVLLEAYLRSSYKKEDDLVFANGGGQRRGLEHATKMLRETAAKAGVKQTVTMHTLRHTYASALIASNQLDIVAISKLLGHAQPSTTLDTYGHLFHPEEAYERARGVMDEFLRRFA